MSDLAVLSARVLLGMGLPEGPLDSRPLALLLAGAEPGVAVRRRRGLEALGQRCATAPDWAGAEAVLCRDALDALLLDLDCPGAERSRAVGALRRAPAPLGRLAVVGLAAPEDLRQAAVLQRAGFDRVLARGTADAVLLETLRSLLLDRVPPDPLDPARRAALLAEPGPEGRRARDQAAFALAASLAATLKEAPGLPEVQAAAGRIAEAFEDIGAIRAAGAARALEAEPARRPVLLPPLFNALVLARAAVRRG
jgi:CheY-like chemotaxis protein